MHKRKKTVSDPQTQLAEDTELSRQMIRRQMLESLSSPALAFNLQNEVLRLRNLQKEQNE
ncbi:MAG: hypothetical protein LBJ72_13780 [Dysgonamonadaceae bacterium]|jgi:hypothetical protein|nr:hypothetical protein [Dysgonamonadaceae bacterium]